jgi:hypothetical protein
MRCFLEVSSRERVGFARRTSSFQWATRCNRNLAALRSLFVPVPVARHRACSSIAGNDPRFVALTKRRNAAFRSRLVPMPLNLQTARSYAARLNTGAHVSSNWTAVLAFFLIPMSELPCRYQVAIAYCARGSPSIAPILTNFLYSCI